MRHRLLTLVVVLAVLGGGIFYASVSYRMSLIPAMSFNEMLAYTTQNRPDALISVGIIRDGQVEFLLHGANGRILPSVEHVYEIGSITKTFTTALLAKAIQAGRVELADSIDRYLDLPQQDYYPDFQRLVTHTSGYKGHYFEWQMASNFLQRQSNDFYGISTQALCDRLDKISLADKVYPFVYSNFGIAVVGSALAEIYGQEFTPLLQEFIASDLGLAHTSVASASGDLSGYWNWQPDDAYIPAGAILSTIGDMLQYLQLHLDTALPYLALELEQQEPVAAINKRHESLGIRIDAVANGWMIDSQNNIIWHNGATSNFNSYLAFDREKQLGVVILSNLPPHYRIPATVMGVKLMTTLQAEE